MYEELLHELYLAFLNVKEDVIKKFNELNELKKIGLIIIRDLFQRRNSKRRKGDSVLMEIRPIEYYYNISSEDESLEDELERRNKDRKLDTMNVLLNTNRDNDKVQLLVMCYNEGVTKVAKDMGTNRQKIYNDLRGIKETLRECIE